MATLAMAMLHSYATQQRYYFRVDSELFKASVATIYGLNDTLNKQKNVSGNKQQPQKLPTIEEMEVNNDERDDDEDVPQPGAPAMVDEKGYPNYLIDLMDDEVFWNDEQLVKMCDIPQSTTNSTNNTTVTTTTTNSSTSTSTSFSFTRNQTQQTPASNESFFTDDFYQQYNNINAQTTTSNKPPAVPTSSNTTKNISDQTAKKPAAKPKPSSKISNTPPSTTQRSRATPSRRTPEDIEFFGKTVAAKLPPPFVPSIHTSVHLEHLPEKIKRVDHVLKQVEYNSAEVAKELATQDTKQKNFELLCKLTSAPTIQQPIHHKQVLKTSIAVLINKINTLKTTSSVKPRRAKPKKQPRIPLPVPLPTQTTHTPRAESVTKVIKKRKRPDIELTVENDAMGKYDWDNNIRQPQALVEESPYIQSKLQAATKIIKERLAKGTRVKSGRGIYNLAAFRKRQLAKLAAKVTNV